MKRYDSSREGRPQFRISICYFARHRCTFFRFFLWRTEAEYRTDFCVDGNRCLWVHEVQMACLLVPSWNASSWLRALRPIPDSLRVRTEHQTLPVRGMAPIEWF